MTKTKKPFDPNAFNYHSHYMGVVLCSLLDINFGYWDVLPCDFKENDDSVLEWIEETQRRLDSDAEYSPVEGMEPYQILEIATRSADHLNHDRMYISRFETSPLKAAESVH